MIVFSDLHLKAETEEIVFDEVLPGIRNTALVDKDKTVIFLGDWYDIRYQVSVRLQNRTLDWLLVSCGLGLTFHMIPGNHDQISKDGNNALKVFDTITQVHVYSKGAATDLGLWKPYGGILGVEYKGVKGPVWAHCDVIGGLMNSNLSNKDGTPLENLEGTRVISGHYHKKQVVSKTYDNGTAHVTYVGSPYQTRADEAGNECGYHVWDPNTQELVFHGQDWGPKYHNLELKSGKFQIPEGFAPRDHINIVAPAKNLKMISTKFAKAGFTDVRMNPIVEAKESRLAVSPNANIGEYAVKYVEEFHGDLPEGDLLEWYLEAKNAN